MSCPVTACMHECRVSCMHAARDCEPVWFPQSGREGAGGVSITPMGLIEAASPGQVLPLSLLPRRHGRRAHSVQGVPGPGLVGLVAVTMTSITATILM